MGVSRSTIGMLLDKGRRTVVDALLHGKAMLIEGGPVAPALTSDVVAAATEARTRSVQGPITSFKT